MMHDNLEHKSSTPSVILIVDDDEPFRTRLVRAFEQRQFSAVGAETFEAAVQLAESIQPERAVVDLRLSRRTGLELLSEIARVSPSTKVVMLTGYGSIVSAIEAVRIGAVGYLSKPADVEEILREFEKHEEGVERELDMLPNDHATPSLARTEWEHIQRILADCKGNISHAADRLRIPRRSLQRKLAKVPPKE